jgi:hypothetical protein
MRNNVMSFRLAGAIAVLASLSVPLHAQTYTVLYNFAGGADGGFPQGNLAMDANVVLYGVKGNGSTAAGAVYSLTPPAVAGEAWTETVLWNFDFTDGSVPNGVTLGNGGVLYGTSGAGGSLNLALRLCISDIIIQFPGGYDGRFTKRRGFSGQGEKRSTKTACLVLYLHSVPRFSCNLVRDTQDH